MIDRNEFFREVSVRICGSLELDKALQSCFQFVSETMPVDELLIVTYDREIRCMTIIATANSQGIRRGFDAFPLTPALEHEFDEADRHPRTRRVNGAGEDEIMNRLARHLKWPPSSMLVNRLIIEGKYIGAFVAGIKGEGRYTDGDVDLWSLVNEPAAIALANHLKYREVNRLKDLLADDKRYLQNELRKDFRDRLVGADFGLREVMEKVRRVAPLSSPVLLTGETGTGKEAIANAIHDLSQNCDGPLVKVNCGAIPETLVDSELFGHEKGAFTGAIEQKKGRFERANSGTIFLDEVSELPPQVQVRLLRVLQEKEIERVGGSRSIKVDVRIISATNRDLESLLDKGEFREDLYFRLNVFPVSVPPLRDRKSDIPALVHHFIQKKVREMALSVVPTIAPGELDHLVMYHWPGNVRELENIVERSIILSDGRNLTFGPYLGHESSPATPTPANFGEQEIDRLDTMERRHIETALKKSDGKVSGKGGAADLLGINSNTLRHRMRKLKIPFGRKTS